MRSQSRGCLHILPNRRRANEPNSPSVSILHPNVATGYSTATPIATAMQLSAASLHDAVSTQIQPAQPALGRNRRPGRAGSLLCARCRRNKQGQRNPCVLDPNDIHGACVPCVKANLSAKCGGATLPPRRLAGVQGVRELQSERALAQWTFDDPIRAPAGFQEGSTIEQPTTSQMIYDMPGIQINRDVNVVRPTHGLDSVLLASNPGVNMDEANRGLYHLGVQTPSISMSGDTSFPSGRGQSLMTSSLNRLRPTSRAIEKTIAACEKFFFEQFPRACRNTIKRVARDAIITLSKDASRSGAITPIPNEEIAMPFPSHRPRGQSLETVQSSIIRNSFLVEAPDDPVLGSSLFDGYSAQKLEDYTEDN